MPHAELGLFHKPLVNAEIRSPRRRIGQKSPGASAVREPAVGDIRPLGAKIDAVEHGHAVPIDQAHALATGAELEGRMEPRIRHVAVGPHQQTPVCRDRRQGGVVLGELPFHRLGQIVREIHPGQVDRGIAPIVQLDPIVVLALRIGPRVAVRRQHLVDHHRSRSNRQDPLCTPGGTWNGHAHNETKRHHGRTSGLSHESAHSFLPCSNDSTRGGWIPQSGVSHSGVSFPPPMGRRRGYLAQAANPLHISTNPRRRSSFCGGRAGQLHVTSDLKWHGLPAHESSAGCRCHGLSPTSAVATCNCPGWPGGRYWVGGPLGSLGRSSNWSQGRTSSTIAGPMPLICRRSSAVLNAGCPPV